MKVSRRSFARSARAAHRRIPGSGNRASVEPKCRACGQIMDALMERSLDRGVAAVASLNPAECASGLEKRSSNAIDPEKLLHFSQQLYAHALTLQEVIRNGGGVPYETLRPRYERQAAQQFEVFYHSCEQPPGFRKHGASAGE
jgi:hypothetical protein